jgi:hypothetical protein
MTEKRDPLEPRFHRRRRPLRLGNLADQTRKARAGADIEQCAAIRQHAQQGQ